MSKKKKKKTDERVRVCLFTVLENRFLFSKTWKTCLVSNLFVFFFFLKNIKNTKNVEVKELR